mmetsp:Transcript_11459/g.24265  ORF Transcript_11459/g.24265 Transcript_11459/m.24265 type:complete len:174 (-) Transcript_11459:334-855(-)
MSRNKSQLTGRVKRLVLADQRVGKVAKTSYVAMARAAEVFTCHLFRSMSSVACTYEPNPKILRAAHLKHVANEEEGLSFLRGLPAVARAPDLELDALLEKRELERERERKKPKKRKSSSAQGETKKKKKKAKAAATAATAPAKQEVEAAKPAPATVAPPAAAELSEDDDYDVE